METGRLRRLHTTISASTSTSPCRPTRRPATTDPIRTVRAPGLRRQSVRLSVAYVFLEVRIRGTALHTSSRVILCTSSMCRRRSCTRLLTRPQSAHRVIPWWTCRWSLSEATERKRRPHSAHRTGPEDGGKRTLTPGVECQGRPVSGD